MAKGYVYILTNPCIQYTFDEQRVPLRKEHLRKQRRNWYNAYDGQSAVQNTNSRKTLADVDGHCA